MGSDLKYDKPTTKENMDYRQIFDGFDFASKSFNYYEPGDPILQYKLLLKQHYDTGISYLCITKQKDYVKYTGSGKMWKRLIAKHPGRIITNLLFTTDNTEELAIIAAYHSILWDVKNNQDFANLVPELGYEENQGNLPEWVRNATPEELQRAREKQKNSIQLTLKRKKEAGIKTPIELANEKLYNETGLTNYMQIPEVAVKCRLSAKNTLLERYGVDHNMKIPEVAAKVTKSKKVTMLERYKVENIMELEEYWIPARAKATSTMIDKYGVSNVSQIPGFKERSGPNISRGLLNRPKFKCRFCNFETKNLAGHERICKLNPDRIPIATTKCEHCGLESINGNYKRWHGTNCKHNLTKGN